MKSTTRHLEPKNYSGAARVSTVASAHVQTFLSSPFIIHPLPLLFILSLCYPFFPFITHFLPLSPIFSLYCPSSPFITPHHFIHRCPSVLSPPALTNPPLPTCTQADVSSTAENWIVNHIYLVSFFLSPEDGPMGLSLSQCYCCLL